MQLVENVKWKYILLLESILVWYVPAACLRLIVSYVMSVGGGHPPPGLTHLQGIPTPSPKGPVTRDIYGPCGQTDT